MQAAVTAGAYSNCDDQWASVVLYCAGGPG